MTSPERVRSLAAYKRLIAEVMRLDQRPLPIDEIWDEIGCMTIVPMKRQMFDHHLETELGFELNESKTHVKLCSRNMAILEHLI
jgi:hypothetical protein